MRSRPNLLCFIVLLLTVQMTKAQTNDFGFKAGADYSQVSNLSTIILSEPYFINYKIRDQGRYGWHLGFYYEYKLETSKVGFQTELLYAQLGGNVLFNNYEKDFNYKMEFAYQYANIVTMVKWFPFASKLSFGVGPFLGINVAPSNIIYTSWGKGKDPAFGSDLEQQQQLRNVLTGKNNFGIAADVAYDIGPVKISGRYYYSITNTVQTQANSYNFIAMKNTNTVCELSVGINLSNLFEK